MWFLEICQFILFQINVHIFFIVSDLSARRQQFPMLHKPKLDNVKQYLETKQQRIEEIKKQRQNKPLVTPGDDSNQQSEENDAMVTPVEQNETPECKKQKVE